MFSVPPRSPSPPHAKVVFRVTDLNDQGCFSCNCDTNAHIKFIFDTAIDDPEWKNPIEFGDRKSKLADGGHFDKI